MLESTLSVVMESLNDYSALLIDLNGVIKGANGLYPGVKEKLEELVSAGKVVILLSNSTLLAKDVAVRYGKQGLEQGVHYHRIVTSGEFAHQLLTAGELVFQGSLRPMTYCVLGKHRYELFEDSPYEKTPLETADFLYISVPKISGEYRASHSARLFGLHTEDKAGSQLFNTDDVRDFIPALEPYLSRQLPAFNANPDHWALTSVPGSEEGRYAVRQGAVAALYQELGGEVLSVGKPFEAIFSQCLQILSEEYGVVVSEARIGMIGDTLETDIRGALNAAEKFQVKLDGILTRTGRASFEARELEVDLERLFALKGIAPDFIIDSLACGRLAA